MRSRRPSNSTQFLYPRAPGQPTDDTALALSLAFTLTCGAPLDAALCAKRGVGIDADLDAFSDVLVRHGVKDRANLHMTVGSDAMFASRRDRIRLLKRAATLIGNEIVEPIGGCGIGPSVHRARPCGGCALNFFEALEVARSPGR